MICAIFGKPTRQDSPLFSVPPSVQVDAQPQEAQAKDSWRGPGHDDRAVQAEKIQGVQLFSPGGRGFAYETRVSIPPARVRGGASRSRPCLPVCSSSRVRRKPNLPTA